VARRIAFVFRTVSASLTQIDPRIEEASTLCGAGAAHTLRRVTVPLVAPGILAGAIIVLVTLISEMSVTILLYSARWKTVAIAIYERLVDDDMPAAAAVGTITIVFTLVLVYLAGKAAGRTMADMFR
jgi:iron(III) transport system permease protein